MSEDLPYADTRLYTGTVTDDKDASKRGTVRVRVQNVLEPDAEARVCMPGSPFSRGMYAIPVVGTEVLVGFLNGELDSPVVMGGFVPPVEEGGSRAATDADDLKGMVLIENEAFVVVLGMANTAAPYFELRSRPGIADDGTEENIKPFRLTLDLTNRLMLLQGPHGISLETPFLNLNGRVTQVRGRPVTEGGEPI